MKQFLLPSPPVCGSEDGARNRGLVRLSGKDYHYLARVRRLRPGDVFDAVEPGGARVRVLVRSAEGGVLLGQRLETLETEETPLSPPPDAAALPPLVLFQALPKGAKMDLIIRQAVEGGIAAVAPFVSARSVPKPERAGGGGPGRLERWRRIVREARQQSGSAIATSVEPPRPFEEALAFWGELRKQYERPVGLLLHPEPDIRRDLGKAPGGPLENGSFHGYLENRPGLVAIAAGPEGGFSPMEAARFVEEGFKPVSMGNTVLRAETAAVYAAAAVRIILLESESWIHRKVQQQIL
ncbi:MAG: 16S rRNA (uracil(1498)-N(3))-methyltransferase [Treponema sp.]|nr:16S rRNA (uracil(1498)-N(3))-methyltransferase [Treponema sp.]